MTIFSVPNQQCLYSSIIPLCSYDCLYNADKALVKKLELQTIIG